ncbi:MAG TPA: FAD-dependent oxidoreductase [Advenella kashmirensis]|uniref:FAD-dependent oxidoreductase n=1 Tax=Advenella kashmirensis TaxID=310575 RepID=A0A356LIN0_9BURK|nr:FAD-dependent oxidoreductase [Advenella kashmirensis]
MTNSQNEFDTIVVGAGQAGIAMSEHLTKMKIPHLILEKNRIAEAWRSRRWDSLVANGPCWHDRFPGMPFDADPDTFVHHDRVADYFERYATSFNAPIRTGVEVSKVVRHRSQAGFIVESTAGTFEAKRIVVATGPFQKAIIPSIAPENSTVHQIHSDQYKNPNQLPQGAILVVGSGSSGVQIADDLNRTGRRVFLSVGPHERPPRRYRNRDNVWWLGVLGGWDVVKNDHTPLKGLAVSGAKGGQSIDFKRLAQQGITLLGMTKEFHDKEATFQNDLLESVQQGEAAYLKFLDAADAYIESNKLDLPEEPDARQLLPDPECMINPVLKLNLNQENISTIIWASGFGLDYQWLQVDAFDEHGRPSHRLGVSKEPGVYFLGLPYLSGRASSFIWGVWHDAKHIADHISIQRHYLQYKSPADHEPLTTSVHDSIVSCK